MYIHEAIKNAQEENLCIKRECWDSARIEFEDCVFGAKECEPCIDGERWMPMAWELTADDWVTCSHPQCTQTFHKPEPVRKKPEATRIAALVLSCVSMLVSLAVLLLT